MGVLGNRAHLGISGRTNHAPMRSCLLARPNVRTAHANDARRAASRQPSGRGLSGGRSMACRLAGRACSATKPSHFRLGLGFDVVLAGCAVPDSTSSIVPLFEAMGLWNCWAGRLGARLVFGLHAVVFFAHGHVVECRFFLGIARFSSLVRGLSWGMRR